MRLPLGHLYTLQNRERCSPSAAAGFLLFYLLFLGPLSPYRSRGLGSHGRLGQGLVKGQLRMNALAMKAGPTTGSQEERKGRRWRIPSDVSMAIICAWLLSLGPELFLLPVACYCSTSFTVAQGVSLLPGTQTPMSRREVTLGRQWPKRGSSPRHSSRGCVRVGSLIVSNAHWEKGLSSGDDGGKQRTGSYGILGLGIF